MRVIRLKILLVLCSLFPGCKNDHTTDVINGKESIDVIKSNDSIAVDFNEGYISKSFDFPVGKPDANGYYNAQKFGENYHLGDDWNAVTGGDSDLGDPIYAISSGKIKFASDLGGGWGNVIRILHKLPDGKMIESIYAHCDSIVVSRGEYVQKGQLIGTIGNANGAYLAHLHFEIREDINMEIGGGYSHDTSGFLNPTKFINENR